MTIALPTWLPGPLTAVWICSGPEQITGQEEVTWSVGEKNTTGQSYSFDICRRMMEKDKTVYISSENEP